MSALRDFWQKIPRPADAADIDGDAGDADSAEPMDAPAPKAAKKAPPKVQKTYVKIDPIAVTETFDDKYKESLPPVLQKALADAVNASAKLTTDEQEKGFHVFGHFTLKKTDMISGHLEVILNAWPADTFFANAKGNAGTSISRKIDEDVNVVIATILPGVQSNMVAALEARAP
jgi:hypothetical protein